MWCWLRFRLTTRTERLQVLIFRDISMRVRRRFPTLDTVVAAGLLKGSRLVAGFMMEHEKVKFDEIKYQYAKYWVPYQWCFSILNVALDEGKLSGEKAFERVTVELRNFRAALGALCNMDWVPIPIMYPQLVVLAVHLYFFVALFSRQYIVNDDAVNETPVSNIGT